MLERLATEHVIEKTRFAVACLAEGNQIHSCTAIVQQIFVGKRGFACGNSDRVIVRFEHEERVFHGKVGKWAPH